MILNLPEHFSEENKNYKAEVRNKILYIAWALNFEQLMYDLAFWMYGEHECYYCHKICNDTKMTIDHVYPKKYGGVSVPANLRPVCNECNREKGNLNLREYKTLRGLKEKSRKKYCERQGAKKEKIRYEKGFDLPDEWIEMVNMSDIIFPSYYKFVYSKKFMKNINFIKKYGHIPKPVILSSNKILLDGRNVYKSAQKLKLKKIPAIVLENVVASKASEKCFTDKESA